MRSVLTGFIIFAGLNLLEYRYYESFIDSRIRNCDLCTDILYHRNINRTIPKNNRPAGFDFCNAWNHFRHNGNSLDDHRFSQHPIYFSWIPWIFGTCSNADRCDPYLEFAKQAGNGFQSSPKIAYILTIRLSVVGGCLYHRRIACGFMMVWSFEPVDQKKSI